MSSTTRGRLPPLRDEEFDAETRARVEPWRARGRLFNVVRVYARHAAMAERWAPWAEYVLHRSTLAPRHREILILRTSWNCGSAYEFAHHSVVARRAGLSDDEIVALAEQGAGASGFSPFERALIRAADELESEGEIGEPTWSALAAEYDHRNLIDLVFTCGTYRVGCTAMNSFGVELEPDIGLSESVDRLLRSRWRAP